MSVSVSVSVDECADGLVGLVQVVAIVTRRRIELAHGRLADKRVVALVAAALRASGRNGRAHSLGLVRFGVVVAQRALDRLRRAGHLVELTVLPQRTQILVAVVRQACERERRRHGRAAAAAR